MSGARHDPDPSLTRMEDRVEAIFSRRLHVRVPDRETDVIDTGLLDSLALVQLLATLEQEFELSVDLAELDLDDFRSVASTARFIMGRMQPG